ncbi:LysM peptidoglycan-binding domain-containing protein [Actinotalea sp. AC32]|nr:LysM peptidoglycan-binding domain-containing protein [Actinotalea sp. AC32]
MTQSHPRAASPSPSSTCLRAAGGTGMGIALAVATVAAGATPAAAEEYTVRPGDTVSHIAARSATSVDAIVRENRLDSRATIRIGQRLTIPSIATVPTQPSSPARQAGSHRVAAGDTVSGLAARYGTTTSAIVQANGLDARALIRIGQQLTIPGAATPAPSAATTVIATSATHRVVAGDTVSALAARHGTSVAAIVRANGLDARATIRVGQTLTVPGASTPTSVPAAVPTAAPSTVSSTSHRVTAGETVSGIAARYGTTTDAVVRANGLDARATIRIGQTLSVPTTTTAAPTTLVGNTFAGRTYPEATVSSANLNKATLLATGVPSKAQMQALVADTARAMGVDPALALAIAYQESGFNHASVSPANAIGTMQVIPSSGEWASQLVGRQLNLLDPQDNVTAGVAILRQLVASAPDTQTAIAGYYQGLAGVRRNGMYPDTRRYVASVQTLMTRFA